MAENFIIKGHFFRRNPKDYDYKNALREFRDSINYYFLSKGFTPSGYPPVMNSYFEQEFHLNKNIPRQKNKVLNIIWKKNLQKEHYKFLRETREDLPFTVKLLVSIGKHDDAEGLFIDVITKPIKYFKIRQLGDDLNMSPANYSFIISENVEFLEGFAKANFCKTLKNPAPLNAYIRSEVIEKLRKSGFDDVANLFNKAKNKLEVGKNIEAIDEFCRVIENFLYTLLGKLGESSKELHQPEKNINLLASKGYISKTMHGVLRGTLFNQIYRPLKDHSHNGKEFDLFDLDHLSNLLEQHIDYLLEKVWKHKIHYSEK